LGLEYEFVVSRFEFGESQDQKYFGHLVLPFWSYHPKRKYTAIYDHGAVYRMESVNKAKDGARKRTKDTDNFVTAMVKHQI
jgi:hypothetical protein